MTYHPPLCKLCDSDHYPSDCCADCNCADCDGCVCERCGKPTPQQKTPLEGHGFLCRGCTDEYEMELLS